MQEVEHWIELNLALSPTAQENIIASVVLLVCVLIFAFTSLFSYSYYGTKCLGYLLGAKYSHYYNYFYIASIILGSVSSITAVISLIDGMFALMAIPTMVSALLLSPKVMAAAKDYFRRMRELREVEA